MVIMTLHYAYWRWDRNMFTDTEHVTVYIHRVTQVPTPAMIANNETRWSPGWNLTNSRDSGGNEWYVRDNGMPINFATLTLSFFAVSALFHLWACVVGLFERFWFFYWRQMDDAFCYWRWLEYSVSASIMASKSSESNHTPSTHTATDSTAVFYRTVLPDCGCVVVRSGHCHFDWHQGAVGAGVHFHAAFHHHGTLRT